MTHGKYALSKVESRVTHVVRRETYAAIHEKSSWWPGYGYIENLFPRLGPALFDIVYEAVEWRTRHA